MVVDDLDQQLFNLVEAPTVIRQFFPHSYLPPQNPGHCAFEASEYLIVLTKAPVHLFLHPGDLLLHPFLFPENQP